jgi:hypothetical protein
MAVATWGSFPDFSRFSHILSAGKATLSNQKLLNHNANPRTNISVPRRQSLEANAIALEERAAATPATQLYHLQSVEVRGDMSEWVQSKGALLRCSAVPQYPTPRSIRGAPRASPLHFGRAKAFFDIASWCCVVPELFLAHFAVSRRGCVWRCFRSPDGC